MQREPQHENQKPTHKQLGPTSKQAAKERERERHTLFPQAKPKKLVHAYRLPNNRRSLRETFD